MVVEFFGKFSDGLSQKNREWWNLWNLQKAKIRGSWENKDLAGFQFQRILGIDNSGGLTRGSYYILFFSPGWKKGKNNNIVIPTERSFCHVGTTFLEPAIFGLFFGDCAGLSIRTRNRHNGASKTWSWHG